MEWLAGLQTDSPTKKIVTPYDVTSTKQTKTLTPTATYMMQVANQSAQLGLIHAVEIMQYDNQRRLRLSFRHGTLLLTFRCPVLTSTQMFDIKFWKFSAFAGDLHFFL